MIVSPAYYCEVMKYFCQADIDNRPYPDSLYRYRYEDGLVYEEHWNSATQSWITTTYLTKMLTGGDCSNMRISREFAETLQNLRDS